MTSPVCRTCAYELPEDGVCRVCGEDHRGWLARLRAPHEGPSLLAQEEEIAALRAELGAQRRSLEEELARLGRHRAATTAGGEVIAEARARLAHGLGELAETAAELDAAALGVAAALGRAGLVAARAEGDAAPVPLPGLDEAAVDELTGLVLGLAAGALTAWSPTRAAGPAWTAPALPGAQLGFAGPAHQRLVLQQGADELVALDAADGAERWRRPGRLLDSGATELLLDGPDGLRVVGLLDGEERGLARSQHAERARLLAEGLLAWSAAEGLRHLRRDGRVLAQARYAGPLLPLPDGRRLLCFPMLLQLPGLEPLCTLTRAPGTGARWLVDDGHVVAWGAELAAWRLPAGPLDAPAATPARLPLPAPPRDVQLLADPEGGAPTLLVQTELGPAAFPFDPWPPQPLDPLGVAAVVAAAAPDEAPRRFRFHPTHREDRARGPARAAWCHELAAWAAVRHAETRGDARRLAAELLRDALVVEAEQLEAEATRVVDTLLDALLRDPSRPPALRPWLHLLDRVRGPALLLERAPDALESGPAARVTELFARVVQVLLGRLGARLAREVGAGRVGEPELAAAQELLRAARVPILARAAGRRWPRLDEAMARYKQLGQDLHELADVAVATRALGRLAQASSLARGASAGAEALVRLGEGQADLAAQAAADAEVAALLEAAPLDTRIAEGLARVKKELRRPPG